MIELGARRRPLPAPPRIVFGSLTDPDAPHSRPWLVLRPAEVAPRILRAVADDLVVWSSLWPDRPDDEIRLDLTARGPGTDLRWTLSTPGRGPTRARSAISATG